MPDKIKAKFSQSTNGVYPLNVYETFPDDALDIPAALYTKFQNGSLGLKVFGVVDGKVVAVSQEDESIEMARESMQVSSAQAHSAIAKSDPELYASIVSYMNSEDANISDKIFWEKAQIFKRLSPTVLKIAELKSISDTKLDELFNLAKSIDA